ncbi:hypothetical protein BJY00DRAFT_319612 [Aspergillus carlsbadensis]|nr:hypothetical protein BJY00DRAFT_319612 [Aspergillus carlsbadensis]
MLHDGKPGFEWWVIEPFWEGKTIPADPTATEILKGWTEPIPRFMDLTKFDTQIYQREIYNRPPMKKSSKERFVYVGDIDRASRLCLCGVRDANRDRGRGLP